MTGPQNRQGAASPATAADLTRLTRLPERVPGERAALDALLDEVLVGTLSTVVDGLPWVVPMLFARDGDQVILHGSTGAGALRQVAAGAQAALCVTAVDGIVVAESTFESSMNYRSAVLRGRLTRLSGAEQARAIDVLSDRVLPGRTQEVRPSTRKELAATIGVALAITDDNWILKCRDGLPGEPAEEHAAWCGVIPLAVTAGEPVAAPWAVGPVPASVQGVLHAHGRMGG